MFKKGSMQKHESMFRKGDLTNMTSRVKHFEQMHSKPLKTPFMMNEKDEKPKRNPLEKYMS